MPGEKLERAGRRGRPGGLELLGRGQHGAEAGGRGLAIHISSPMHKERDAMEGVRKQQQSCFCAHGWSKTPLPRCLRHGCSVCCRSARCGGTCQPGGPAGAVYLFFFLLALHNVR